MPPSVFTDLWAPFVVAAGMVGFTIFILFWAKPWRASSIEEDFNDVARLDRSRNEQVKPGISRLYDAIPCIILVAALMAMYVQVQGRPTWPPPSSTERLFLIFIAAGALGALVTFPRRDTTAAAVAFVSAAFSIGVVLYPAWSGTRAEIQSRTAKFALNRVRLHLLGK